MSSTLTPFLYQTRTIQRAWRRWPSVPVARLAHSGRSSGSSDIPFDWGGEAPVKDYGRIPRSISDITHNKLQSNPELTLSPNEAHIFKRIFEEIAEGKMPAARHPRDRRPVSRDTQAPQSLVEHARMTEFRDQTLERFPTSLRIAADKALGLFEVQSADGAVPQVSEEDKALRAERQQYTQIREVQKRQMEKQMNLCENDFDLWKLMEEEVFSLPLRLGLVQRQPEVVKATRKATTAASQAKLRREEERVEKANAQAAKEDEANKKKYIMDVHGALYSHYLLMAVRLFDSGFAKPSLLAFQILPRVKALGLTSYVLGASTPFYEALASMHWDRYGDAKSALDVIQEMNAAGLYGDEDVLALLGRIRDHLTVCSLGVQGPFVAGMTEAPPYDAALLERVEAAEASTAEAMGRNKHERLN